jgi:hypothetical protein
MPRGGPLVPVRNQLGLKDGGFSPALLVPVVTTETKDLFSTKSICAYFQKISNITEIFTTENTPVAKYVN